jgi:hypothetical protein
MGGNKEGNEGKPSHWPLPQTGEGMDMAFAFSFLLEELEQSMGWASCHPSLIEGV